MQPSHIDNIERALALFMVVAWRIAYLMRLGLIYSEIAASHFFDPNEIRGAYLLTKERRPNRPPPLNEVLRLVTPVGASWDEKATAIPE
jgi:hypothetical protein